VNLRLAARAEPASGGETAWRSYLLGALADRPLTTLPGRSLPPAPRFRGSWRRATGEGKNVAVIAILVVVVISSDIGIMIMMISRHHRRHRRSPREPPAS
jgi:hypothetical protein